MTEMNGDTQNLTKRSFRAASWVLIIKFIDQFLHIFFGILMVRYLEPSDFGVLGMLAIFWAISNLFIQGGFCVALLQKKEVKKTDLSSVFYYNVLLSFVCCFLMLWGAPYIASFYNESILSETIRVSAWMLPISSLGAVQRVILSRKLQQGLISLARLLSFIVSSTIALYLAFHDFGVWSLVWFQFSSISMNAVFLVLIVRWIPSLVFSFKALGTLFQFGSKLLAAGLLDCIMGNAYSIVIGKFYTAQDLGYYEQARKYSSLWPLSVQDSITIVLFPAFSKIQDNVERLRNAFRRSLCISVSVVAFPSMLLAVLSKPIIELIMTPKWLPVIPIWILLTVTYVLFPFHVLNLQLLNARGRSDKFLLLEIIKRILVVVNILVTYRLGLIYMMVGMVINSFISLYLNTYFSSREIHYPLRMQIKDCSPYIIYSTFACLCAYACYRSFYSFYPWVGLFVPIFLGTSVYIALNWASQSVGFVEIIRLIQGRFPFFKKFLRDRKPTES